MPGPGLEKSGIAFSIFERNINPESWLEGYRIHVNPIGSRALHTCLPEPLWQAFLAATADPKDGFGFLTEQLEELVCIDESLMIGAHSLPQHKQYAISRILLRKILLAGIEEHIYFGRSFHHFELIAHQRVRAFFDDRSQADGDLLVGADGANSTLRKQYLPYARRVETDAIALAGRTRLTVLSRQWIPSSILARMNVIMPARKFFFFSAPFDHKQKISHAKEQLQKALSTIPLG